VFAIGATGAFERAVYSGQERRKKKGMEKTDMFSIAFSLFSKENLYFAIGYTPTDVKIHMIHTETAVIIMLTPQRNGG
jgi:hypothetical protein